MAPAEKGTCSDSIQRYVYNVNMAKCLLFEYSGCEGNLNNFETIEECDSTCDILIQMSRQASALEEQANLEAQKKGDLNFFFLKSIRNILINQKLFTNCRDMHAAKRERAMHGL